MNQPILSRSAIQLGPKCAYIYAYIAHNADRWLSDKVWYVVVPSLSPNKVAKVYTLISLAKFDSEVSQFFFLLQSISFNIFNLIQLGPLQQKKKKTPYIEFRQEEETLIILCQEFYTALGHACMSHVHWYFRLNNYVHLII